MSRYQCLEHNLNINNNPKNFKEKYNIGYKINIHFILVHKHLDITPQSCHEDNLHILIEKKHIEKGSEILLIEKYIFKYSIFRNMI